MFAALRKAGYQTGVTPQVEKYIDLAISQLKRYLLHPAVVKTLTALKIDNPYKYLAKEFRSIAAKLDVSALSSGFDNISNAAKKLLTLVSDWGGAH